MITRSRVVLFWIGCVAAVLVGCASPREHATFVTKTSFSLVDIDTVPAGVSIAYDRVEGYIGPRYRDGNVFPFASWIESRGADVNRQIRQVYAAGNAARIVTAKDDASESSSTRFADSEENKVMFFATGTTVGVKVGFAQGTLVPSSFTLGYKRKEASVIPVDPGHEPSALGTFDNAAGVDAKAGADGVVNFAVEQYFATGSAADNLARKSSIRTRFQEAAAQAVGDVVAYRNEEARQGRLALDTLNCFSRLGDDKLDRVWANAEALGLLTVGNTVQRIRAAPNRQRQREIYVGDLGLLDADKPEYTILLALHKSTVCGLAGLQS